MLFSSGFRLWGVFHIAGVLLLCVLLVSACSDDPILGPDDGEPDDSGGSYSVIKRLAPADTSSATDTTRAVRSNPERF